MASITNGFRYDVFLSFRGEDTRYAFTGNLRKALTDRGIRIFFDEEDLQKGNEITPSLIKAIEESRMAIVVLSENYASSSFCLQELSKILDCIKEKGRLVLPIFYKVDPSDVRKLKRTYGEAMDLHETGTNDIKLPEWKKAFITVANLAGFHYRNGDGYEHEFIEKIVEQVSKEIEPITLPVPDYPVGLESQKQNVASLLNISCKQKQAHSKRQAAYSIATVYSIATHITLNLRSNRLFLSISNACVFGFEALSRWSAVFDKQVLKMARPLNTIKSINDSQMLWRVAVRIVDKWTIFNKQRQEHMEMVIMDACGDKIQVVCPSNQMKSWKTKLLQDSTYVLENFMVFPNNLRFKLCEHPFKLVFCTGTLARDQQLRKIPLTSFNFKDFGDILHGKFREDFLVDVIGAVHNRVINQMHDKPQKVIVSLRDTSENILNCTLWESVAQKFLIQYETCSHDVPVIMILTHTMVKQGNDKYPPSLSNSMFGCKLILNADIDSINTFRSKLPILEVSDLSSQMSTQMTADSRFLDRDKFQFKAQVLTLKQINELTEDTDCITVATTGKLLPNGAGWFYDACTSCPKGTNIKNRPFLCQGCGNSCVSAIPRYKVEIQLLHEKATCRVTFWDKHCITFLGVSANDIWKLMLQEGEIDRKSYPMKLDELCGITMVLSLRVQPQNSSISVSWIDTSEDFIAKVNEQIQSEETSKLAVANKAGHSSSVLKPIVDNTSSNIPSFDPTPRISKNHTNIDANSQTPTTNEESNTFETPVKSKSTSLCKVVNLANEDVDFQIVSLSG